MKYGFASVTSFVESRGVNVHLPLETHLTAQHSATSPLSVECQRGEEREEGHSSALDHAFTHIHTLSSLYYLDLTHRFPGQHNLRRFLPSEWWL
jgi:hypothetical protein